MKTEILDSKQFGIEPQEANKLKGNLPQILLERSVLENQYDDALKLDLENTDSAKIARELRLKIKDNRVKGIQQWHTNAKEYFLRGGQFVDAIKRKEIEVNHLMENKLTEIENYAENKEKERIKNLQNERENAISLYLESDVRINLGEMEPDVWEAYFSAKKLKYEQKIEEEKQ